MLTKFLSLALSLVLMALCSVLPAAAHPHIFIDAKLTVVFDNYGAVSALRHQWTFDEAFSAWAVQGLDTNKDGTTSQDELQDLANDNVAGLAEYGFYTLAGKSGADIKFVAMGDQTITYENGRTTLRYSVAAQPPYRMQAPLELGISDPEYYVAISFADASAVTLENAPAGCGVQMVPPQDMDPALTDRLYALGPDVVQLPPDLAAAMAATQGLVVIHCPSSAMAPSTALGAVSAVAAVKSAPFGGPPSEPGLPMPQGGIFKTLSDLQRDFYAAMTGALGQLRTDTTAFWLLGGLSFLYGVIHAAGPGHGKVVISSYMLANETQVRRGIGLSVLSAMMQSVVAVAFVLIAAGVLGMTSMAMSDAATWITIASYAMVVVLGLWLIARKLFGWGHAHHHPQHDHHGHDHDSRAHEHVHIVTPEVASGSWREQLSVVAAVGLRPCSGALVVLVFALSQGVLAAGIAAVFLMGLGTAITVALLATLAVTAKGLARRIGGADNAATAAVVWWAELLGAVAVLGFGVVLLLASI